MLKSIFPFIFLLFFGGGAVAQSPDSAMSSAVLQSCFMGTPAAMWTHLKLTGDQMNRLKAIQEACKSECDLPGVKKDPNAISNSDGSMVISELKNILTMDEYATWTSYCAGIGKEGNAPATRPNSTAQ